VNALRAKKLYSFWIDPNQAALLKALKERDGIPESEQIRRALDAWLEGTEITEQVRKTARRQRAAAAEGVSGERPSTQAIDRPAAKRKRPRIRRR
jgi:hypothetical protein